MEFFNFIVGIDFMKSNEWIGKNFYGGWSLYVIGGELNFYEKVFSIIGWMLLKFDDDNFILCFGFGDFMIYDKYVFSFNVDYCFCEGFEEVFFWYWIIVLYFCFVGFILFVFIINVVIDIVEESGG